MTAPDYYAPRRSEKGRGRRVSDEVRARFVKMRYDQNVPRAQACLTLGVSVSWAMTFEHALEQDPDEFNRLRSLDTGGLAHASVSGGAPIPRDKLSDLALRCLDDFEMFRAKVLGRRSLPWAVEGAHRALELYETDDREYAVVNVAPGVGKTTLYTTDIPLWLTARDRAIRGAVGSVKLPYSTKMVSRIKREFERLTPIRPTENERLNRNACDAETTMAGLFGRFRPLAGGIWRQDGFLVEQMSDEAAVQKELTWSAASVEGDFIAERLNFMSWDDAQTVSRARSNDIRERDQESWDRQIEERLEPGGLLLLVMQRIHVADLSRHNLNKYVEIDSGDDDEPVRVRKYHHIVFRAHDETRCKNDHGKDAKPWPKGCLIDPKAKPWRELKRKLDEDPDTFHLVEQQDDTTQTDSLVQRVWLEGGQDKATKVLYEGCLDKTLPLGTLPGGLPAKLVSYCTVDPSATNYWCIQWWLHDPETGRRWLIDMRRRKMSSSELIEAIPGVVDQCRGLMVDWQERSRLWRRPIKWWVIEQNGAQRYLLQQSFVRRWAQANRVRLIGHETWMNKADAKLGVRGLLTPIYRTGLVRIPAHPDTLVDVRWFLDELMSWPNTVTQDGVMAQWMGEHNLHTMVVQNKEPEEIRTWRPSWVSGGDAGPSRAQLALMRRG